MNESNQQGGKNLNPVMMDLLEDSQVLLVSFGGIANRIPLPRFEAKKTMDNFPVNKVYIRDFDQCWYTRGLKGLTKNPGETAEYLKEIIAKYGNQKTIFIGNSAGAYASLLFGQILEVDEVHAFSPQTFLDFWNRWRYLDFRWKKEIKNLQKNQKFFFDLKRVFKKHPNTKTTHHIYWDSHHKRDTFHVRRMMFPNVEFHDLRAGGHNVMRRLRNKGELIPILEKSISVS